MAFADISNLVFVVAVVVVVVVVVDPPLPYFFPSNHRLHPPIHLAEVQTMLYHEKLDVYQLAIKFTAASLAISDNIPKGYASLCDQLRRASMSVPLNIAEGVGKPSGADAARFHAIARGSAMECAAILDVVVVLQGSCLQIERAKEMVQRIVEMLSKMCR
jgi:four helix bundle protein